MVSVDNDIAGVFFNGTRIANFIPHGECPIRDEFRFDVPQGLVLPGNNLVAFHLVDRPPDVGPANESFFDTRILAELAPDQLANAVDVQQAPLVPVSDVTLDCRTDPFKERTSTTISYVVAGTEQLGEITVEQSTPRAFTVEGFLDGERMALGTITPDKATVSRSPRATRGLASLDAGVLSVGSVLPDQTTLEGLFQCVATPAALSCETTCDLKAARSSAIASILEGFTQGGGVTTQRKPSSVGAAFAADFISAAAESRTISRIEKLRQQCRALCPPPPQCSDGRDNDGNGKTDFPADPGCSSATDDSERPDPPPQSFSFLCNLSKVIPFQGLIGYTGTCGGGLIQGTVIRIRNPNNIFIVRFPKFGKTIADCNNPQAVIDVKPGDALDATGLQQVLGTSSPRLPIGGNLCAPPGVSAPNLPPIIPLEITARK